MAYCLSSGTYVMLGSSMPHNSSGYRSLVFSRAVRVQAVAASAGAGIVERNLQVIISQKPIESGPRLFPPAALSRCKVSLQTGGNYRASLDGLLVEAGLFSFLRVEAVRSDGYEVTLYFATLNRCQPT